MERVPNKYPIFVLDVSDETGKGCEARIKGYDTINELRKFESSDRETCDRNE